jgi:hypothetical protein
MVLTAAAKERLGKLQAVLGLSEATAKELLMQEVMPVYEYDIEDIMAELMTDFDNTGSAVKPMEHTSPRRLGRSWRARANTARSRIWDDLQERQAATSIERALPTHALFRSLFLSLNRSQPLSPSPRPFPVYIWGVCTQVGQLAVRMLDLGLEPEQAQTILIDSLRATVAAPFDQAVQYMRTDNTRAALGAMQAVLQVDTKCRERGGGKPGGS